MAFTLEGGKVMKQSATLKNQLSTVISFGLGAWGNQRIQKKRVSVNSFQANLMIDLKASYSQLAEHCMRKQSIWAQSAAF